MNYDVAVIGGGFAGLNFARHAAKKGLKVIVLEKDRSIGSVIRTTGILIEEAVDELKMPKKLILNKINKIVMNFPDKSQVSFVGRPRFHMAETNKVLKWLAKEAIKAGAVIKTGCEVTRIKDNVVYYKNGKIKPHFIIGADGINSLVAREYGLAKSKQVYLGLEEVYSGVKGFKANTYYCYIDYELAPGYLLWAAPRGNDLLIGLVADPSKTSVKESLKVFKKRLKQKFDFSKARLKEKKVGTVAINGNLKKTITNNCLLVGDAAGQVWPLDFGGIYPALYYSRMAAGAVKEYLVNDNKSLLINYQQSVANDLLSNTEGFLRTVYNRFNSNDKLNKLRVFLKDNKQFFEQIFFNYRYHYDEDIDYLYRLKELFNITSKKDLLKMIGLIIV